MDGWKFLEERGRDADLAGIPVVALSASRGAALAGLGVPVIQKPFALAQLQALVREFCAFAGPT
jgi:hypothetical protein